MRGYQQCLILSYPCRCPTRGHDRKSRGNKRPKPAHNDACCGWFPLEIVTQTEHEVWLEALATFHQSRWRITLGDAAYSSAVKLCRRISHRRRLAKRVWAQCSASDLGANHVTWSSRQNATRGIVLRVVLRRRNGLTRVQPRHMDGQVN